MEIFDALSQHINLEIITYQDLLELEKEKKLQILSNNIDCLSATTIQEGELIKRTKGLEIERQKLIGKLRKDFPQLKDNVTFKTITEAATGRQKELLEGQRARILRILNNLQSVIRENAFLLHKSIGLISKVLHEAFDLNTEEPAAAYSRGGMVSADGISKVFDWKV